MVNVRELVGEASGVVVSAESYPGRQAEQIGYKLLRCIVVYMSWSRTRSTNISQLIDSEREVGNINPGAPEYSPVAAARS